MTVSFDNNKKGYAGNGSTTAFSTAPNLPFYAEEDLYVVVQTDSTGAIAEQTLGVDYTVSGGDGSTGTVTMTVAPASGETLFIERQQPRVQTTDLVNNTAQNADTVEGMDDKSVLMVQQMADENNRSVRSPFVESASMELPAAIVRRGKYLRFEDTSTAQPEAVEVIGEGTELNSILSAYNSISASSAADKLAYATGLATGALADLTSFGRSLIAAASATAARVVLAITSQANGSTIVESGTTGERDGSPAFGYMRANSTITDIEWYNGSSWTTLGGTSLNSILTAYNSIGDSAAADKLAYATGASTGALADLTAFGRSLIDDAAAINGRITLGSASAANGSTILESGTTGERDGSPAFGYIRANSTTSDLEWYNGSSWTAVGGSGGFTRATVQATTSGTQFDFTGLPSSVRLILVVLDQCSLSGTDDVLIQIGDSGGIETTGYVSTSYAVPSFDTDTTGFSVIGANAGISHTGIVSIANITGNTWVSSLAGQHSSGNILVGGGSKTLTATLTQVRITRTGTNTFDAGQVNILYQ